MDKEEFTTMLGTLVGDMAGYFKMLGYLTGCADTLHKAFHPDTLPANVRALLAAPTEAMIEQLNRDKEEYQSKAENAMSTLIARIIEEMYKDEKSN